MQVPVVVHRWFRNGEDWAYHPMLKKSLLAIVKAVEQHIKRGDPGRFEVEFRERVLLGEILTDEDCPNPQAKGRTACVFRAALLERNASTTARKEAVYEFLSALQLPLREGENSALSIECEDRDLARTHQIESPPSPDERKEYVTPEFEVAQSTQLWHSAPAVAPIRKLPARPIQVGARVHSGIICALGGVTFFMLYTGFFWLEKNYVVVGSTLWTGFWVVWALYWHWREWSKAGRRGGPRR